MDEAFRSEMAAGYTLAEPAIVLGSPLLADEVLSDVRVQVALSRVNRHGLIAGATGTGKTKTLQIFAGQLSALGVPVFAVDVKGDLSGIGAPGDATDQRTIDRCTSLAWTFAGRRPPARGPVAVGEDRCPRAGQRQLVRSAAAGQGPRPQRDPDLDPVARVPLLRRPAPAAARPRGPAHDPQVPGLGRRQACARGPGRHQPGLAGRDPAGDRDDRAGGRRHLLRRARVRRRRPAAHHRATARGS